MRAPDKFMFIVCSVMKAPDRIGSSLIVYLAIRAPDEFLFNVMFCNEGPGQVLV